MTAEQVSLACALAAMFCFGLSLGFVAAIIYLTGDNFNDDNRPSYP
jgi:hypothetical protein